MAILGNTIKVEQERVSKVPFDVTKTINPGDMMKWDGTNRWATPIVAGDAAANGAASDFIGVSNDRNQITSLNQNLPFGQMNIVTRGLVEFTVDDNATYYPGDPVTIGAGPQYVRKTGASAANQIGFVAPENDVDVSGGSNAGIASTALSTKLIIAIRPGYTNLTSI